jgi:hypothetical protein
VLRAVERTGLPGAGIRARGIDGGSRGRIQLGTGMGGDGDRSEDRGVKGGWLRSTDGGSKDWEGRMAAQADAVPNLPADGRRQAGAVDMGTDLWAGGLKACR